MKFILNILALTFLSVQVHARVFNFKSESMGAYFNGSYGLSRAGQDAFANSSGSGTQFETKDSVPYNTSFELGFFFLPMDRFSFTVSALILQTKKLVDIEGKNSSNTKLFDLTSSVFVFNPKASFEFTFTGTDTSRFYAHAGIGYFTISLDNAYTFTADGLAAFPVTADYTEKSGTIGLSYTGGIGYEFLAVDNVTLNLELGFRWLKPGALEHKHSYTTINGAVAEGDNVTNDDGTDRDLDLGGGYIGLGFRFYINVI